MTGTRRTRAITFALAVGMGSACAGDIGGFDGDQFEEQEQAQWRTKAEADALAAELGLPEDHDCPPEVTKFKAAPGARKRKVFAGKALPWHKWRRCLKQLGNATADLPADSKTDRHLYSQVLYLLSHGRVKLYKADGGKYKKLDKLLRDDGTLELGKFDRVVDTNDHGVAYSVMGQVDFAHSLLGIHRVMLERGLEDDHRTKAYRALGLASYEVVIDQTNNRGLRSVKDCEKKAGARCAWLHAKTSEKGESAREGGTLNKHLYAARYLDRAATLLEDIDTLVANADNHATAARYRKVAVQALNQMVYSASGDGGNKLPNLMDYIVDHKGKKTKKSWLYYGRNIVNRKPYHLDNESSYYKNCNYHLLVLRLLRQTLDSLPEAGLDLAGFTKTRGSLGGRSVVDFLLDVYEVKLADGLYDKSKAKGGGNFWACSPTETKPLEPEDIDFLRGL